MHSTKHTPLIEKLFRIALECADTDEFRRHILEDILKQFGCERGVFLLGRAYPTYGVNLNRIVQQGLDDKYWVEFRGRYYKFSPFLKALPFSRTVVGIQDLVSAKDYEGSDYYNEFLKPQSIYHEMAIQLRSKTNFLGTLALYRAKNEHDFSAMEKNKAELIAPYLSTTLERFVLLDKTRKVQEIVDSICPNLPCKAVIALDDCSDPVYMNDEARKMLSNLGEDEESWQDLFSTLSKDLDRESAEETKANVRGIGTRIHGDVSSDTKNTEETAPLRISVIRPSKGTDMSVVLLGQNESRPNTCRKLANMGLTKREIEVTLLVSEGLKNSEIGQKLFISEYTVENHLRSIYEKLSVRNRTTLAHELSRIARTDL
jgi:DNA-binding CsgD family transcriptional regulator